MKVNKNYIYKIAFNHYDIYTKTTVCELMAKEIAVSFSCIKNFLTSRDFSRKTVFGIQKILNLDPAKIFVLE